VSRLLKAMGESGFLSREPGGLAYIVGPRSLVLGELYLAQNGLLELMEHATDRLVREFGFVGYISKVERAGLFILRRTHGSYPLRLIRDVGQFAPAFQTASGRAILAHMSDEEALQLVKTDPAWGQKARQVIKLLAETRVRGVSMTISTGTPGVAAIAAAVRSTASSETLAFSLSYPIAATDAAMRLRMACRVREEAAALGQRFSDEVWALRGAEMPDLREAVRLTDAPLKNRALVGAE
jgi:DNA-binding IclR family transcriptional regulator